MMGLVLIFTNVPTLLLLLLGGVVVDRLPRIHLMLFADFSRAAIVGFAAFLAIMGRLEVWQILIISALFGIVEAFFYPAYAAIIPEVVPTDALSSANSLRSISLRLASIVGPLAAGWIIMEGGSALAFGFDALSFVLSAFCLLALPKRGELIRPITAESSALQDMREGIQTVFQSPWLWITIAIAGVSNITLSGPLEAALPLLVKQHFAGTAEVYGQILAAGALGSIVAAIGMGWRKRLRRRGYLVYGPWLVACLALTLMGLPLSLVAICLAMGIFDASVTTLGLAWGNSLQELVPAELLGRVNSIDALGSYSLLPLGYALAGIAADHIGASMVFLVGGIVSALVIGSGLFHPNIRAVD